MAKPARYQVFVYGTLRSGRHNHGLLENSEADYIGDCKVGGYLLVDLGAFPCVFPTYDKKEFKVMGEVYSVDAETLARLDQLEGVRNNFYMRQTVDTDWGRAFIYVMHPSRFEAYRRGRLFWMIEGDYDDSESLMMEDKDILTYIDHVYLTAAGVMIPDSYRELQPVVVGGTPEQGEDREEEPPKPTVPVVVSRPKVQEFDWSDVFPDVEEAS